MRPTLDAVRDNAVPMFPVILHKATYLRGGEFGANKKLPPQARDESTTPAVPPLLSHLWPVTAPGYCLRGYQPPHPTCSPRCGFLRRAAHGPVHRWGFSGFHHLPIRCKHPFRLLIPLIAGLRHTPLFNCVAQFSTQMRIMQARLCASARQMHPDTLGSTAATKRLNVEMAALQSRK